MLNEIGFCVMLFNNDLMVCCGIYQCIYPHSQKSCAEIFNTFVFNMNLNN